MPCYREREITHISKIYSNGYLLGEQEFAFCGHCENICEYESKAENDKQEDNVSGNKHAGSNNSPITFIAGSTSEISNHEKHH